MNKTHVLECPLCGCARFSQVFVYEAPPRGEVKFNFSTTVTYHRKVLRCGACGHFVSVHEMDMSGLYQQEYVDSTYGSDGLRHNFERITSLEPAKSDNVGRVERILVFAEDHLLSPAAEKRSPRVLDIGSGLCVFLHRMKEAGWECTALDPDPRAVEHARDVVGVKAVCGDLPSSSELGYFDMITFNKVLEHIQEPVAMLAKSAAHLNKDGFVYVEVPDGEMAVQDGPEREEFFIEHHHVFSMASLALMVTRSGFVAHLMERVWEPSSKYTLRAFMGRGQGTEF